MLYDKKAENELKKAGWKTSSYQPGGEGNCIECYANRWVEWYENAEGKLKKVVWGEWSH